MSSTSCRECGRHLQNGVLCGLVASAHLKSSRLELFPDVSIYYTVYLKNNIYYTFPGLNCDFGCVCGHWCVFIMEMLQWTKRLGKRRDGERLQGSFWGLGFGLEDWESLLC